MSREVKSMQAGEAVRAMIADLDRTVNFGLSIYRERGDVPSCDACAFDGCCRQEVFVHFAEALPIAEQLHESEQDTPEFRAKLIEEGIAMERASRETWFDSDRLCVFHSGAERGCSVYHDRPAACRCYFVITPAAECGPPSNKKIAALDFTDVQNQSAELFQLIHHELGLRENQFRLLCASLPRAVWIWLGALDLAKAGKPWQRFVNHQPWPSEKTIATWIRNSHEMI